MLGTIYLGGPDVFLHNALEVGARKMAICRQFDFDAAFPFDVDEIEQKKKKTPEEIFQRNHASMNAMAIGLFNLTPFRGPSADAGTIFELGYMLARGKAVFGYSSCNLTYEERVAGASQKLRIEDGRAWDQDNLAVEDHGLSDNLMIVKAIEDAGGFIEIVEERSSALDIQLTAFRAFEACLKKLQMRCIAPSTKSSGA